MICTTIEQSKRLLEVGIKPETADMVYLFQGSKEGDDYYSLDSNAWDNDCDSNDIPAWSLSALLGLMPEYTLQTTTDGRVFCVSENHITDLHSNPINVAVEMIEWIYENGYLGKEAEK